MGAGVLHHLGHALDGGRVDERADLGLGIARIADVQALGALAQPRRELVGDGAVDDDALGRR
jgi:hypothetical protein